MGFPVEPDVYWIKASASVSSSGGNAPVTGGRSISVEINTGGLLPAVTYSMGAGSRPHSLVIADFNQDDKLDIAVADYGANTVASRVGTRQAAAPSANSFARSTGPPSIRTGDPKGDRQN